MRGVVFDVNLNITLWGLVLMIGTSVFLLSTFIATISFFFSKSATAAPKGARVSVGKTKRRCKLPTGPPSADVGGLASQLASSGPPSAATGPPSAVGQPTVSAQPPTPPSFLASASSPPSAGASAATDKPTCPFCGKALRFIDEYQRWYCDSCAQYV